ncbi:hypothetical protein L1276_004931 [Flavobacterium sp. HSC-32F16]|uniref:hypothetical protein n=1 Tax=Flavobacterium sp. HSC-32F16 TaxID=2910964 RepID=UPI0020A2871A|nr:hypothetical protein [Flavobacterium sp. HSC-32F16]MCP2029737.1 hypothetical protein [Flavobacterium sp. HSC-32F16]
MYKYKIYFWFPLIILFNIFCSDKILSQDTLSKKNNYSIYNNYLFEWKAQLNKFFSQNDSAILYPLIDPNHSRIPYWFLNDNQAFNQGTYDFISSRVIPGPIKGSVKLSIANSFTNSYKQLMTSIRYQFNSSDKLQYEEQIQMQKVSVTRIVSKYEELFGVISQEDIEKANKSLAIFKLSVHNKLDYIFLYAMGYLWSGMNKENKPPLQFNQLVGEKNLEVLLPHIPASGALLLFDIIQYFDEYLFISTIDKSFRYNSNILSEVINNTRFPNKNNGGIVTFDLIDGKNYSFSPSYEIGLSIAEIQNSLNDHDRVIEINLTNLHEVSLEDNEADENKSSIFKPTNGQSYLLTNLLENMITIKIEYKGYVLIPVSPLSYLENKQENKVNHKQPNSWGWFYEDAINQSIKNLDHKRTGFCFVTVPPYNLGSLDEGGDFGRVSALLAANLPTVTIHYKKNNSFPLFNSNLLSVEGLLNLPFLQINDNYSLTKYSVDNSIDKVVFEPLNYSVELKIKSNNPKEIISVPIHSKTVALLMVGVVYPSKE